MSKSRFTETFLGVFFGLSENLGSSGGSVQGDLTPIFWTPFFLNETVSFAFVIHKARRSHRVQRLHHDSKPSLIDTLIQHSIQYYLSYVRALFSRKDNLDSRSIRIFIIHMLGSGLLIGLIIGENVNEVPIIHHIL